MHLLLRSCKHPPVFRQSQTLQTQGLQTWIGELYFVLKRVGHYMDTLFNPQPTNVVYIYGAPSKARNANIVCVYVCVYVCMCVCVCIYIYIYVYIYRPTFGNAESCLSLFAAQCFSTESMQSGFLCPVVCKHFASQQCYPNQS